MVKTYYIDVTGSMCYEPCFGVTFPDERPMNFNCMLRYLAATNVSIEPKYGWDNMPDVLTFDLNDANVKALEEELGWGFLVYEKDW